MHIRVTSVELVIAECHPCRACYIALFRYCSSRAACKPRAPTSSNISSLPNNAAMRAAFAARTNLPVVL